MSSNLIGDAILFLKGKDGRSVNHSHDLAKPETALSPQRQLSLLVIMHQLCKNKDTQFIIATHSPILLAYPGATIYSCDSENLSKILYTETEHYRITKQFLDNPSLYVHHLFQDPLD